VQDLAYIQYLIKKRTAHYTGRKTEETKTEKCDLCKTTLIGGKIQVLITIYTGSKLESVNLTTYCVLCYKKK